jgi:hypothetical protein
VQSPPVERGQSRPVAVSSGRAAEFESDVSNSGGDANKARQQAVGSADVDRGEIDHLKATLNDLTAVFDDSYVMGTRENGEEFSGSAKRMITERAVRVEVTAAEGPEEGHSNTGGIESSTASNGIVISTGIVVEESNSADHRVNQSLKSTEELRQDAVKRFVSGFWAIEEDGDFWVHDDSVWYCKKCSSQFSMFMRKHHCRRCGGVFCADDAPHVDMLDCLPESFREVSEEQ